MVSCPGSAWCNLPKKLYCIYIYIYIYIYNIGYAVSNIGHNVLSDTESFRPPNESARIEHEFVVWIILRQIIAKLEESTSSFPGERA